MTAGKQRKYDRIEVRVVQLLRWSTPLRFTATLLEGLFVRLSPPASIPLLVMEASASGLENILSPKPHQTPQDSEHFSVRESLPQREGSGANAKHPGP